MLINILKFLGLLVGIALINLYSPFGIIVTTAIVLYALWNLVNKD